MEFLTKRPNCLTSRIYCGNIYRANKKQTLSRFCRRFKIERKANMFAAGGPASTRNRPSYSTTARVDQPYWSTLIFFFFIRQHRWANKNRKAVVSCPLAYKFSSARAFASAEIAQRVHFARVAAALRLQCVANCSTAIVAGVADLSEVLCAGKV